MEIQHLFDVKGKVVLVTGGAKGIGRMIAEGFVANGAKVYLTGHEAAACERAAAELTRRRPGTAHALPADLQQLEACRAVVATLEAREPGGLAVLVNNAGATWGASLAEYPDHAWSKVLMLNLQRVFSLTQLCLPSLRRAAWAGDRARVIHVGSIDGLRVPAVKNFAYAASKAGLHHLSRVLAVELGGEGITSNVLACGPFPTKMMRATLEEFGESIRQGVPLERIGEPEDVAGACLFLGFLFPLNDLLWIELSADLLQGLLQRSVDPCGRGGIPCRKALKTRAYCD